MPAPDQSQPGPERCVVRFFSVIACLALSTARFFRLDNTLGRDLWSHPTLESALHDHLPTIVALLVGSLQEPVTQRPDSSPRGNVPDIRSDAD